MEKTREMDRVVRHSGDTRAVGRPGWALPFAAGLLLVAAIGVLVLGVMVVFQITHSETVFPGVHVGQVALGGLTREEALSELQPLLSEMGNRSLAVRALGTERQVKVTDLGASFDVAAAVESAYAVGRKGGWIERLAAQLGALARGYEVEAPGLRLDRAKLQAFLAQQAQGIDRPVKDAQIVIGADQSVQVTPSVVGRRLDIAAASAALERALSTASAAVDLPVQETLPQRVEKDLQDTAATLAKMLSGPVALEFEGRLWSLSAKEIAALIATDERVGLPAPVVSLKEEPLRQMVDRMATEIDQPKVNARFDWNGGNLKLLRPGQDGRKVNREKALAALRGAINGDQRTVALPVEIDRAAGTGVDPTQLGIKERIEFGQTTLSGVPEKIHNIKLAASRLNGVLLAPGDTFSFNRELGPTTLKAGFQTGFGISVTNGQMETVPSVAGGICQVATTLLHAVFWAGYQIEERYPHMYWIPNYGRPPRGMVGLDATVDDPTLDLKFVNNTEDNLLIQSTVQGNTLEFALYGVKPNWKVEVEGPIITNVVKADPKTVRQEEPSWPEGKELWVESATDGMDVDVIRRVTLGSDTRTLHLKSRYVPSRNVLMVGTMKPPTPAPGPTSSATPRPGAAPGATPGASAATATPVPGGAPRAAPPPAAPSAATPVPPAASPARPPTTPPTRPS